MVMGDSLMQGVGRCRCWKHGWWLLALVLVLVGCGFHGFSVRELAKHLSAVRLMSANPYDEMNLELVRKLRAQGIRVLIGNESIAEKIPLLSINARFSYRTFSSLHSTTARVYNMRYVVDFSLVSDEKVVASQRNITVERDIVLQPNEMFEVTSQVGAVKREMCDQMVRKIIQVMILRYENQTGSVVGSVTNQ